MVNKETTEIAQVLAVAFVNELLRRDAFFFRAQHDRRAVRVVSADVMALVAAQALEAYPNIGLDVFDHVAEVNRAVGIRQGAGDKNAAFFSRAAWQSSHVNKESAHSNKMRPL